MVTRYYELQSTIALVTSSLITSPVISISCRTEDVEAISSGTVSVKRLVSIVSAVDCANEKWTRTRSAPDEIHLTSMLLGEGLGSTDEL